MPSHTRGRRSGGLLEQDADAVAEVHPWLDGLGGRRLRGDVSARIELVSNLTGQSRVVQDKDPLGRHDEELPVVDEAQLQALPVDQGVVSTAEQDGVGGSLFVSPPWRPRHEQQRSRHGSAPTRTAQRSACSASCRTASSSRPTSAGRSAHEYVDNDLSAYSGKRRPEYERMLADLADGARDAVLICHVDRLTRRPIEREQFLDVLTARWSGTCGSSPVATWTSATATA